MIVHVPTAEEIHRIAFLTVHGWFPNGDGSWSKEGVRRDPPVDPPGYTLYKGDLGEWSLEAAYHRQRYGA